MNLILSAQIRSAPVCPELFLTVSSRRPVTPKELWLLSCCICKSCVLYRGLPLPSLMLSLSTRPAADTPIEEFTPTPAFPALQYLESVDEGGVAWQAGLRTGDFLIEVRHRGTAATRWLVSRQQHRCAVCPDVADPLTCSSLPL